MTMIKVKNEESGENPFESQKSQEQHVSRVRRRRSMTSLVRVAHRTCTGVAGQDAVVVKLHHEKRLIEVIINKDLQELGADIFRVVVPIIRKKFGYHMYPPENGGNSESLQPMGARPSRPHEEKRLVKSLVQRKRKTSDNFSMLYKRHKLTDQKEVEQSFNYAAVEDDKTVASSEDDASVSSSKEYSPIKIGDKKAVERFYKDSFMRVGQANLKSILKVWIKVIEPKKQSIHPYNGGSKAEESKMRFWEDNPGELTKPCYWPSSVDSEGRPICRHKEPDHLTKNERLILATSLLCNEGWAVEMLRTSTQETLSLDQQATTLLDDIYDMREKQEQLSDGAIDDDVTVPVRVLKTTTTKKKSASTRQYSEPKAIAAEQRSLPELALPRTHNIIGNELPTPRNNAVLNILPGSNYPSACASAEFYQQSPLQEVHVGGMAPSPYSGPNAQIQFPMPIPPTQQVPLQALSTAALIPGQKMTQTMSHDGNPIPQAYAFVRSQSVVHEQSPSYNDWGTSGHRQHDFNDDAVANRYSPGYTSIGYPISDLTIPLLPLSIPENHGRPLPPQIQFAQTQSNHNVLDDNGDISHAQHRR